MKHKTFFLCFLMILSFHVRSQKQDSLSAQGVLTVWSGCHEGPENKVWLGGRVIPQFNYSIKSRDDSFFDLEASANLYGSVDYHPSAEFSGEANLKAYRAWARYSGRQFELRLGLQKINFGSATLLRPLMWFDRLDPRDPLQLTGGVWGLLGRYYFLNNANVWIWGLWGNKGVKTWETGITSRNFPELGGRLQFPVMKGEAAFSYHYRETDMPSADSVSSDMNHTPEHRFGLDGKWDIGPGIWFETTWIHKTQKQNMPNDQELGCLGTDYTFPVGNGLNAMLEHLLYSVDRSPFTFENLYSFTAFSLSYPIGINDHLTAIIYRDWKNRDWYNFISWQHRFNHFSFYLMGFLNPKNYYLPQQGTTSRLFAGNGFQLMLVYNY